MCYAETIRDLADENEEYVTQIRRRIHENPEIGWDVRQTAELVRNELDQMGIPWQSINETGTIATLPGKPGGCVVALRADMDALPVQEATGLSFASKKPGFMHACGHDMHTAMLLGATRILNSLPERPNDVRLIFQPAEEIGTGAFGMIDGGAIEGVDVIYGSHVFSCVESIEPGKVLLKTGALMAGSTKFEIRVEGHGGHGSQPEACDNPLPALVAMYTAINQIKSFFLRGDTPIVTSIGFIQCGTAMNIIPASGALGGTIRWFLPEDRDLVLRKIREIAESCANIYHVKAVVHTTLFADCVMNEADATEQAREALRALYGDDLLQETAKPLLGSEDFSFYCRDIPGVFAIIEGEIPGKAYPNHNPQFDIDEGYLKCGMALYAQFAVSYHK